MIHQDEHNDYSIGNDELALVWSSREILPKFCLASSKFPSLFVCPSRNVCVVIKRTCASQAKQKSLNFPGLIVHEGKSMIVYTISSISAIGNDIMYH